MIYRTESPARHTESSRRPDNVTLRLRRLTDNFYAITQFIIPQTFAKLQENLNTYATRALEDLKVVGAFVAQEWALFNGVYPKPYALPNGGYFRVSRYPNEEPNMPLQAQNISIDGVMCDVRKYDVIYVFDEKGRVKRRIDGADLSNETIIDDPFEYIDDQGLAEATTLLNITTKEKPKYVIKDDPISQRLRWQKRRHEIAHTSRRERKAVTAWMSDTQPEKETQRRKIRLRTQHTWGPLED